MKTKFILLMLCGLLVACRGMYEQTCSAMRADIEQYKPYLVDVYKDYSDKYMPLLTETGDTVLFEVCFGYSELSYSNDANKYDDDYGMLPNKVVTGACMMCRLIKNKTMIIIAIEWNADHNNQTFSRVEYLSIDRNTELGKIYQEGDVLYINQPNGDRCVLQKGIGIVEITCHDGRSWRPI